MTSNEIALLKEYDRPMTWRQAAERSGYDVATARTKTNTMIRNGLVKPVKAEGRIITIISGKAGRPATLYWLTTKGRRSLVAGV